ncbi:hypothetical protein HMPREF9296_0642 [Prevotella disiens FB035-09AN]|uniref:Uncharacterized protein n=1 Tax=Prevotella disiens FB035-09AN TaxID=866771 RepID=E1KUS7_9BACT|nr:hypothetical protein HMPREF9296_0642 [Prevotella disiens FB035-09AN]
MIYHVPNNKDNLFADRNVINHAPTRKNKFALHSFAISLHKI